MTDQTISPTPIPEQITEQVNQTNVDLLPAPVPAPGFLSTLWGALVNATGKASGVFLNKTSEIATYGYDSLPTTGQVVSGIGGFLGNLVYNVALMSCTAAVLAFIASKAAKAQVDDDYYKPAPAKDVKFFDFEVKADYQPAPQVDRFGHDGMSIADAKKKYSGAFKTVAGKATLDYPKNNPAKAAVTVAVKPKAANLIAKPAQLTLKPEVVNKPVKDWSAAEKQKVLQNAKKVLNEFKMTEGQKAELLKMANDMMNDDKNTAYLSLLN